MPSYGSNIRVSDRDRDDAAAAIREHYAAGRLDDDEMDERLKAAYAAKTEADLAALRADLPPALRAVQPRPQPSQALQRRPGWRRMFASVGSLIGVFAGSTIVWAFTGAGYFWPEWILVPTAIAAVGEGMRMLGGEPERRERERRH
jgi:hypothetical protein